MLKFRRAIGALLICGLIAVWAVALATAKPTSRTTRAGGVATKTIASGSRLHPGTVLHAPARVHGRRVRRYQWERCNARGRSCGRIRGATHRTYRLTRRDEGHTLIVRMVVGTTIIQSAPTGVVGPPLPVNTTVPVISDTTSGSTSQVTVGDQLTGTLGAWTGAAAYAWAWQHCNAGACSTVASGGPTSNANTVPAYTIAAADVGDTLQLVVTAYNTPQG